MTLVIVFGLIPTILFLLGKAATAGTAPDPEQMKEVRRIAIEISERAEEMLTEGTQLFTGSAGERLALDGFIRFADGAERFQLLVLSPVRSRTRYRNAFQDLVANYERLVAAFPALKAYRSGQDRLDRVGRLVEGLKRLYDAQPASSSSLAPGAPASGPRKQRSIITQSSNKLDPPLS